MKELNPEPNNLAREAILSVDRKYRYSLTRYYRGTLMSKRICTFIMLNPSTADALSDDSTIRKCLGFIRRWDMHKLIVVNLFALRSTDPLELSRTGVADPIGPDNDEYLVEGCQAADLVVCAWGNHGTYMDRGDEVLGILDRERIRPYRLGGLTALKQPRHPLYVPYQMDLGEMR